MRLGRSGDRVTVIERESLPGGLAAGFQPADGLWLEKFYHHLFRSDTRAIAMIEQLGLGDRLEWREPVTATLHIGRPY
ncbi:MAG: FAD-dependent oxidoreductase, partial [Chloroflexi bacterium]|nr:FAD-dependent oxidoreductase [Chloroflexota bacterium]